MKLLFICLAVIGSWPCYADPTVEEDPVKKDHLKGEGILGNPKDKLQNGRSIVAVNEHSQERSSRFFGPSGFGMYPGYGGPAQFPGGMGGTGGYSGGYGGYGSGYGYPGYFGGYPGGYGYPGGGAFAGHNGFGYGLQQQQQLQGGGFSSGAFAG